MNPEDECGFWLQVNGVWLPLDGVEAGVSIQTSRPMSEQVWLGGVRTVQVAARAPRSWSLQMTEVDPSLVTALQVAAARPVGLWLWDESAARVNLLPASATKGSGTAAMILVDDLIPLPALPSGVVVSGQPLRAGPTYTISAWTTKAAGSQVFTYQLGSGGQVAVLAPSGSGPRRVSVTIPDLASDSTLAISVVTAGTVSGLGVSTVASDHFFEGHGTPCPVHVKDPQRVLQWLLPGQFPLADYSIDLLEVSS